MVGLHFREAGDGQPLLLLHGLFGAAANWGRQQRELAADYRVIAADLRNHGRSPHAAGMDYPALAADVLELVERLGLDEVTLVGHSLGGKVAMTAALLAPERVARLVVVDIAPRRYRARQADVLAALVAVDLDAVRSRADAAAALAGRVPDPAVRAFLLTNLVQRDGGYRWRFNLPAIVDAIAEIEDFPRLGQVYGGPSAFIRGAESDYLDPLADRDAILRLFPAARFATVPGAGHWVHAERPEAFLAVLVEQLEDGR